MGRPTLPRSGTYHRLVLTCLVTVLPGAVGCGAGAVRSHALIDRYRQAACVPLLAYAKRMQPRSREWDYPISLRDGSTATVFGYQAVGGAIDVTYSPGEVTHTAANAGDYVYPTDVRLDAQQETLYIKADGSAGGFLPRTFLFQYDLSRRTQVRRLRVDNAVLPAECPQPPESPRDSGTSKGR